MNITPKSEPPPTDCPPSVLAGAAMMHDDMCNNKEDIQRLMGPQGPRDTSEAVSTSSEFTHHAIVLLVEAMRQRWDMYGSRERSRLFQSVQEELEGHGYPLPVERIRRKWNNLIVTYKRVKERCRGSSQAKTSWEYFEVGRCPVRTSWGDIYI